MKIIVSPTKQMVQEDGVVPATASPRFLPQTRQVMKYLQGLSLTEAQKLWGCSDELAEKSYDLVQAMSLEGLEDATPAILAYDGIAFKYMAPSVFEDGQFDYVQEHLCILSAMFGVLRPLDGVVPYRLEMQAKAAVAGTRNLYAFWGHLLYEAVLDESRVVVNLASKEYSKCIEKYLQPEDTLVTCVFGELSKGRVVQKGVYAKMARGDMVRFMAEHAVEELEQLKAYDGLGYAFAPELSDQQTFVYLKG